MIMSGGEDGLINWGSMKEKKRNLKGKIVSDEVEEKSVH